MKSRNHHLDPFRVLLLSAILAIWPAAARAVVLNPDLTAAGVIAALKADAGYTTRPYSETYNLGATGLRGWIYIEPAIGKLEDSPGATGLVTASSRQILVAISSAPGNAVLQVDDVILGAIGGSSTTAAVPMFSSDCRKAFGKAIGDAENTGAGTLRVKRWRGPSPGTIADVNIPMAIFGNYVSTAPYSCPKSALILANARTKLVGELLADPNYLTLTYGGAIKALALLAGVSPGDANYSAVQTRLKDYAKTMATMNLVSGGMELWDWSYMNIFLSEFYMRSLADGVAIDPAILPGINNFTVSMAKGQSRYGTFSHGGTGVKADGSLHGTVTPYGPVNAVGIPTNVGIVMGKIALVAGNQSIDPEINLGIQRASDFFGYYMNKGSIPYGEHEPVVATHASNGKDAMCAALFGLQDSSRLAEAEYYARMSVSGYVGHEYGHTGQGLSYLWGAIGANMGGPAAAAGYMGNIQWHLDLERRTDGSFSYGGGDQYGAGPTADNTYLGACGYNDMSPTAIYILNYGVSLNRLYITGRNNLAAHTLTPAKVTNAIAAATYRQDCPAYLTSRLIADLGEYDPVVRYYAALQLGTRSASLTPGEVSTLMTMAAATGTANINSRMGACQALGAISALNTSGAVDLLVQRLSDPDLWVRAVAAKALRNYGSAAVVKLPEMLTAFVANATDPDVIAPNDPVQIANRFLSLELFGDAVESGPNVASSTINAPKNLLYPAIRTGLRQPDSYPRYGVSTFTYNYLTVADAQALTPELFAVATTLALADTMWHRETREISLKTLIKFNASEALPIARSTLDLEPGWGWHSETFQTPAMNFLAASGESARWTLPGLRQLALNWNVVADPVQYAVLNNAIASIEAATTSPVGFANLNAVANSQVVVTSGAKAITLTGSTCRGTNLGFFRVTTPSHGSLSGSPPNLTYTPTAGYTGPDSFTFRTLDTVTTSEPGTVSIIVGAAGNGLKGEYFDNVDFTNLKVTRTDSQLNFDWGTASPDPLIGADTFSARWTGQLLVPETATYKFSSLSSDGVRLYVNGALVLDGFTDKTTSWTDGTSIDLSAGQRVELMMEYYENTGSAVAKLKWTGPSFAGLNGKIIGQEWFYSGASATNRVAYAHPQSVTMAKNTTQSITLAGSGVVSAPLGYTVVGLPTNGDLGGTPPLLTYSPYTNFTGPDSFSLFVNNGNGNSATVTISLTVLGGISTPYFWTNPVDGNWNDTGKWTNSAGAAAFPVAGGQDHYNLNFNKAGTYTTTQNHGSSFLFNQLNVGGSVVISGTNSLTASANGPFKPKINQNSNDNATVNTPVILAAATTLGGSGAGVLTLNGNLSGSGSLTMSNKGRVILGGANSYTGGTVVNSGSLEMGLLQNSAFGPGPITMNSGSTLMLNRAAMSNSLFLNNAKLIADNGWGDTWSGPVTLTGNSTFDLFTTGAVNISGVISGTGGLTKMGSATLTLSGANTYSGTTRINAGSITCTTATALGQGRVVMLSGTKLNLNFSGTHQVASLSLGGIARTPGTYGSNASQATNKDDTYFTGGGVLSVLPQNSAPVALAQNLSTAEDNSKAITLTGTDAEGNTLVYTVLTRPTRGTVTGNEPYLTYSPPADFNGTERITFKVNDGTSDSAVATVSITVTAVNDAPVVTPQSVTTAEDTPRVMILPAYDVDNSALTYWTGNSTNGTVTGTFPDFTFTPALNFNGVATFEYSANDGSVNSPNATVYVNVTPVNDAPVANPQTITAVVGNSSAVTLAGTDVDGNPLTYSIVGQPARGTVTPLTGSQNVTYTPTGTNVGTDSFTFKVNDGTTDSATATVSVTVTNSGFTWNTTSNNWSNAASWTSGAPGAAGQAGYVLNFNMVGSYTATNDLNSGFLLNRINFGSNVTLAGNRLALSVSGSTSPQLSQNSANLVTVANNLELNATTTLGGTGSGAINLSGTVFGSGGLIKSCTGDVYLNGTNSYTGGTTITAGMLHMGVQKNSALGFGLVTLNPGTTLELNRVDVVNSLSLNSATLLATNGFGDNWSGSISLSGTSTIDLQSTGNLTFSGVISGSGGLTKVGNGTTLTLSGISNSYSGTTTVSSGTLSCTNPAALGKGPLVIATGAKLNLPFSGITQASTLSLGGIAQGNGTYGSTSSTATNKNDTWFIGTGVLNVGAVASVPFTWNTATTNSWGTAGSWTSGTPAAAGQSNYVLNFNVAGTYTANNNLNAGFLVNQLNFGGSSVTLTGSRLALSANVSTAPQLSQNSTSAVTVSNDLALNANTLLAGTSSGTMTLSGIVSGSGGLIKSCSGNVLISGVNTYTGGTTVTAGTLSVGLSKNQALGTGAVTLNTGSTLVLDRVTISNSLSVNSATVLATNGFGDTWSGPVSLSGIATFDLATSGNLILSGAISGSGVLKKAGNSTTLTLSGTGNTYSGGTIISGGTLSCNNAGALGQGGVSVATGAKLGLAFSGTRQVATLTLGGISQPGGTYGSNASSATNKNDTYFSGTGVINVASSFAALKAPANHPPVFTANPTVMGGASQSVAYTGQTLAGKATDADAGDILTYSKVSGPAWLVVASSGALSGTPPAGSVGQNRFVVRVTDSASATADTGLRITVAGLPAPWVIGSIGKGMPGGSTSYRGGTFSQSGSGALGITSDKLSFSYQTLSGDGDITAKISALQDSGNLSGVGVMIRETLAPNSKHVFMGMTGSNKYLAASRVATGGPSTKKNVGIGTVPNTWVRLVRVGNVITGYKSIDGIKWTPTGSTTVTMAASCYIGLAVSSGSNTTLNSSQFSNLSVTP